MKIVRDRKILDRIGCHGKGVYALYDDIAVVSDDAASSNASNIASNIAGNADFNTCSNIAGNIASRSAAADTVDIASNTASSNASSNASNGSGSIGIYSSELASDMASDMPTEYDIDNTNCDAEFETVDEGYDGIKNCIRGTIYKMYKGSYDKYPTCLGIYSSDGMYKMDSKRAVSVYPGKNGRAECIAIPQCKMMNSTVLDQYAKHSVRTGVTSGSKSIVNLGESLIDSTSYAEWLESNDFYPDGQHVPFDLWCIVGAVFGKALKIWRGIAKLDMSRMPTWMYIEISEIFESLNPGCRWCDLSVSTKELWTDGIVKAFVILKHTALAWDLPCEGSVRIATCTKSILDSSVVYSRVGKEDESRCREKYGDAYEPCGLKVHVRGGAIFDFCWKKGNNSPAVVQIRSYEHDCKKIFGTRGWTKCFQLIWASWLIQYRNYWKKRNREYNTCELEWSQQEMLRGFKGSVFEIRHLSTEEMVAVVEYHSRKYVCSHHDKRPAHVDDVFVVRRCVVGWTIPKSLSCESVLVKDSDGMNMSLEDAGIRDVSEDVSLARSRMQGINEENLNHIVTVHGKRIDVCESVIFRLGKDEKGNRYVIDDKNGRCYSKKNGVQSLNRKERSEILIDGHRTREVDYSSLHPNILYAMNGISYSGDIYDVGNWYEKYGLEKDEARKACKKMMLIAINARNKAVAMQSFKKEWNAENGKPSGTYIDWLYTLYDSILAKHHSISHEFCTGKGVYLMNLDGKLIREVCHRLTREKICSLGIHDSVVVEAVHAKRVASVMREEYSRMFGGNKITVKSS